MNRTEVVNKTKQIIEKGKFYSKKFISWYIGIFKGRPWYIKMVSTIGSFIVLMLLYMGAVDINLFWLFGKSPSMSTIINTRPAQASEIYSADDVLIGKFFSENRTPVTFEDVNPVFWQALIDTEDERYYHHFGIDFPAFGAALKDYVIHGEARGASTITQQLAKNLFRVRTEYSTGLLGNIPGVKMLIMKTKEWITAVKLEVYFDKNEILTMYANTVDFGSNAYGIKTACKTYFGITPKNLKPEQAAILVGMLKATTYYNPRLNPQNSLNRRNVVLDNMLQHGHLTKEQFDTLSVKNIDLDYSVENAYDGQANYFREALASHLKDWCNENGYDLYTDGLKIYTTIDTRMQKYAEDAALEQMKHVQTSFNNHWGNTNPWRDEQYREIPNFIENIAKRTSHYKALKNKFPNDPDSIEYYLNQPHPVKLFSYDGEIEREMSTMDSIRYMVHFMHCGFVAMEPHTGHIKAWVGDLDFKSWKYDKVTAMRQPGSTFKLFVYTEAMNQGLTPVDTRTDTYLSIKVWDKEKNQEVNWMPHNADGITSGADMPLKAAFAKSINTIAARLGQEVGIDKVAKTAHRMGIKSNLQVVPALALGASDVNLLELVNSYATIANDGQMHEPVFVTRILDRDGNEIYKSKEKTQEAVSYRSSFFMQQMLMGGLHGTSWALNQYVSQFTDTDFGGKTGTSNNHSDAWFVGVSPKLVCGAWVGGEYRAIHFRTGALGQGGVTALPICGKFYKAVLSDPAFKDYRTKFNPCHDKNITPSMYEGGYYYEVPDSLQEDSTAVDEQINEDIDATKASANEGNTPSTTE
ncbi:transglycosylase domain-containing protein [Xylanibacter brevis]|uniref:transglycosylase domain-containing protein n=1 Tax=Xylanibacter brevis TaxID=83231 RepID=UPI0006938690